MDARPESTGTRCDQSSGWLGNGCCGRKQCAVHISVVDVPSLQNTKVMGPKLAKLPLLLLVNICA